MRARRAGVLCAGVLSAVPAGGRRPLVLSLLRVGGGALRLSLPLRVAGLVGVFGGGVDIALRVPSLRAWGPPRRRSFAFRVRTAGALRSSDRPGLPSAAAIPSPVNAGDPLSELPQRM